MKNLINMQAEQITSIMINSWEESSKIKPNVKTRRRKGKWPEKIKSLSIELAKMNRKKTIHSKEKKLKTLISNNFRHKYV